MPTKEKPAAARGGACEISAKTQECSDARELFLRAASKEAAARRQARDAEAVFSKLRRARDRAATAMLAGATSQAAEFEKLDGEYQRLEQAAHDAALALSGLPQASFTLKRGLARALNELLERVGDPRLAGDRTSARAEILEARRALLGRGDG